VIRFAIRVAAVAREFVERGSRLNVLRDAASVLQAEPEIVCPVGIAVRRRQTIKVSSEDKIRLNPNTALQADSQTVFTHRVFQSCSLAVILRCPNEIARKSDAVLKATPNIIKAARMGMRRSRSIITNRPLDVLSNTVAPFQAAAECVRRPRIA
jgi:hypothetical protein